MLTILTPTFVSAAQAKPATTFTIDKNNQLKSYLDFDNKSDFEDAKRGFIAKWPEDTIKDTIKDSDAKVVWDFSKYDFIDQDKGAENINPSLSRQAKLNNQDGLFKVADGVYQVRGFDLSVMSFIRSDNGWIVIDPLISEETSRAGLKLLQENVDDSPVVSVIFTLSHVEHFGGIWGVTSK